MSDVKKKWTFLYMLKTLAVLPFHFIAVSLGVGKKENKQTNKQKTVKSKEMNVLSTNSDFICHDMT